MWDCNKNSTVPQSCSDRTGQSHTNTLEAYDFGFLTTPLAVAIWCHTEHISSSHTHFDVIHVEGLLRRVQSLLTCTLLQLVEVEIVRKDRSTLNQFICEIQYHIKTFRNQFKC